MYFDKIYEEFYVSNSFRPSIVESVSRTTNLISKIRIVYMTIKDCCDGYFFLLFFILLSSTCLAFRQTTKNKSHFQQIPFYLFRNHFWQHGEIVFITTQRKIFINYKVIIMEIFAIFIRIVLPFFFCSILTSVQQANQTTLNSFRIVWKTSFGRKKIVKTNTKINMQIDEFIDWSKRTNEFSH